MVSASLPRRVSLPNVLLRTEILLTSTPIPPHLPCAVMLEWKARLEDGKALKDWTQMTGEF